MNPALAEQLEQSEYDRLPDVIRQFYSPREWAYMTDSQRANVIQSETEPEA